MIGGHDISFPTHAAAQVAEGVLRTVCAVWRQGVVENAETSEIVSLTSIATQTLPCELLIYKNIAAKQAWAANGATSENTNSMVHLIRGQDSITVVVDDPHAVEMSALIKAIRDHVSQDILWMRADAA